MTIEFGLWLLPLLITIVALTWGWVKGDRGIGAILYLGGAVIVSLIAWLVWALLT